jgi:hypothetical protein
MKTTWVLAVSLVVVAVPLGLTARVSAQPASGGQAAKAPALSAADQKLLDGLLKQFLFDPKGAQYVRVKTTCRTVWASSGKILREGWLVPGQSGKTARVCFTDGETIVAPRGDRIEKIDFVDECRKRYAETKKPATEDESNRDVFRRMHRTALGQIEQPDLVLAAWLYRLDQPELAAKAMAQAHRQAAEAEGWGNRENPPNETEEARMVRRFKEELAWPAFAAMVHAYMVRADEEALAHGERLLRLCPDVVKKEYTQADAVVAELKRRKAKGTFGKTPPETWPEGFDSWEQRKKIAWLIDSLDEVDARQWGQPGGVPLGMDRRVAALIEIGDPAVPALIDAVEKDGRLTRSVHFWRDFARSRTVLSVREAALTAAMSILKVRVFEPNSTGDNFTGRGEGAAAVTAQRLREYWRTYGALPYDDRMMKTLADPKASFEAVREAAYNLANLGEKRTITTTVFSDWFGAPAKQPNPAVAKFTKPTAAEAIVAAMDRDLAHHDAGKRDQLYDYERRRIEDSYLGPLVELGDRRIAAELARRSKAATAIRMRRKFASACQDLGDPEPLKAFARDVEKGSLTLPGNNEPNTNDNDQPGTVELSGILASLVHAGTAECDRALYALAAVKHPYHALVVQRVLSAGPHDEGAWLAHPFCLAILRDPLNDTTPTGATWKIEGDSLTWTSEHGSSSQSIPDYLADPAARRRQAMERRCDEVAVKLGDLVIGLPAYSPLMKDADARLATMKRMLDRYQGHFRMLTGTEAEALGLTLWSPMFVPDVTPLGRTATAEDVEKGRAVFHLDGKGKLAEGTLPAVATLRQAKQSRQPLRVLVVQAEVGQDGKTTYGIIGGGAIRAARAEELVGIKPMAKKKPRKAK